MVKKTSRVMSVVYRERIQVIDTSRGVGLESICGAPMMGTG